MHCLITAGPTYENLDQVRRLTNFSTGSLGLGLAQQLAAAGHSVTLFLGEGATVAPPAGLRVVRFSTTENLRECLRDQADAGVRALFHAAAVSDFRFGKVWERTESGELRELRSGKLTTRQGTLLAELLPTPKLIAELRSLFPQARLVGWKYEVDGSREEVVAKGVQQIRENRTDACVLNGPAYGPGFGWHGVDGALRHLADRSSLLAFLTAWVEAPTK
jgi:phosphopantothenoylcysteine synthetase/decarboxylase